MLYYIILRTSEVAPAPSSSVYELAEDEQLALAIQRTWQRSWTYFYDIVICYMSKFVLLLLLSILLLLVVLYMALYHISLYDMLSYYCSAQVEPKTAVGLERDIRITVDRLNLEIVTHKGEPLV